MKGCDIVQCPRCNSGNLQAIVESNTTTSGGGYSGGKGCLGFLLFGPLGLLCGTCGNKQNVATTNKTLWICHNCGNKFGDAQELMKEKKTSYVAGLVVGILFTICGIFAALLSTPARADAGNLVGNVILFAGLLLAAFSLMIVFGSLKAKRDYEQLKRDEEKNSLNRR